MLPNSPSDCHAPFTSPVAKVLYPQELTPRAEAASMREALFSPMACADAFDKLSVNYALAQQAEYRDKHLHHIASELVAMAEHDFDDNSWAALLKLTEQAKLILLYLNPPTP